MSIVHLKQLQAHLQNYFVPYFLSGSDSLDKIPLISQSLAAFAVCHLAKIEAEFAAYSVTDGTGDNGIDAIYFSQDKKIMYFVQSKWSQSGNGSVNRGEIKKFLTGVDDILKGNFDRFNAKLREKQEEIEVGLGAPGMHIMLVVIYSGKDKLSEDVERDIRDYLDRLNDPTEVAYVEVLNLETIYEIITNKLSGDPIDLTINLQHLGRINDPYLAYYGTLEADQVAEWWDYPHSRLFASNIRLFLEDSDANAGMSDTLKNAPQYFWYYNNGITALCSSIERCLKGSPETNEGQFFCKDVSIVNGAQTVGAIAAMRKRAPLCLKGAKVLVRFIALSEQHQGVGRDVARATNTQNRINLKDFVAFDPNQERLKRELELDGIKYVYKSGDEICGHENGFGLHDATVALACANKNITLSVYAKNAIGKLWADIKQEPYIKLFNPALSGRYLWCLVQVQKIIEDTLRCEIETNDLKMRQIAMHGVNFIAHVVFKVLHNDGIINPNNPNRNLREKSAYIEKQTKDILGHAGKAMILEFRDAYIPLFFKTQKSCMTLLAAVQNYVDTSCAAPEAKGQLPLFSAV